MRYAIQIVTDIGGSGRKEIKLADRRLVANDGKWSLQLDVENTGERWLRPSVVAELYNGEGGYVGRFEGDRFRIYPGCSVRTSIGLNSLPAGKYSALIVLDSGDESVWGARYHIEIK